METEITKIEITTPDGGKIVVMAEADAAARNGNGLLQ
jgi:hypothetical protein